MAILITGGTGKNYSRVARLAKDAQVPFLIASRKGEDGVPGMPTVKFDWFDSSTFENRFQYKFANGEKITAVYLVLPPSRDPKDLHESIHQRCCKARREQICSLERQLDDQGRPAHGPGMETLVKSRCREYCSPGYMVHG